MSGKAPITAMLIALFAAGCATAPDTATTASAVPAPVPVASSIAVAKPQPKPMPIKKRPSTASGRTPAQPAKPAAYPTPRPAAGGIAANVTRNAEDNSLLVSRGAATEPVPLFRQAIVLANVRAAVAGLPSQPKAEFQRGLLTLTFPPGSQSDVPTAINKALGVPEVTRLRANLPQ